MAGPAGTPEPIRSFIDKCTSQGITGWAFHASGPRAIRVSLDGDPVGEATWGMERPDVAQAWGDAPHTATSGFLFAFPTTAFAGRTGTTRVCIEIEARDGTTDTVVRSLVPFSPLAWSESQAAPAAGGRSPLPADVVSALHRLRPDTYAADASWTESLVEQAVTDVVAILDQRADVKPVLRYGLYLRALASVVDFVGEHFPLLNQDRDLTAKDRFAAGSTAEEMLCIAHHLYVLRSHGLDGALVECGCFKGFSTCCLSHACAALGIRLEAFDSFSGLPPSPDHYYEEGDFRGTLDEVRDNLRTLGRLEQVTFHPGFFADTVPAYEQPLLALWMDVDLMSSAADALVLLPRLPVSSALFTHECVPDSFVDGLLVLESTEVMPPIFEAFVRDGRDPCGRFLGGSLGVVYDRTRGIPVLAREHVARIARGEP
jgi:hypothetical protein